MAEPESPSVKSSGYNVSVASKLLRPNDHVVYGNSPYPGLEKQEKIANHPRLSRIECRVNRRSGRAYESTPTMARHGKRR